MFVGKKISFRISLVPKKVKERKEEKEGRKEEEARWKQAGA